jgi:hypothetical protein
MRTKSFDSLNFSKAVYLVRKENKLMSRHEPMAVITYAQAILASSALLKELFIHLMAWKLPVMMFCALITSLNVPSPFFAIIRYFLMASAAAYASSSERAPREKDEATFSYAICSAFYSKLLSPESSNRCLLMDTGQLHANCLPFARASSTTCCHATLKIIAPFPHTHIDSQSLRQPTDEVSFSTKDIYRDFFFRYWGEN